ncbi:MAG: orotidine-5'-phosphate decarboxylase [Bacteroidales bacterium]|nr:orotidine-5'-phosphate decarboxylase [Bacteroidales bacterium]
MTPTQLFEQIQRKHSFLCVGLDADMAKTPEHLRSAANPIFEFNRAIIDATHHVAVAYKPNTAFYEAHGTLGWEALEQTVGYIKQHHPEIMVIADAKRGDIGNTAKMYARAFFERMDCDAITLSPYMGHDSVEPYLEYPNRWAILLGITSNLGYADFQTIENKETGLRLFEEVLQRSAQWGGADRLMYVVGATRPDYLKAVRRVAPNHFLLVPGVGAQGGRLDDVARHGMNRQCGLLVNSSRSIIYADTGRRFAEAARCAAVELQGQMQQQLQQAGLI